MVTRRAKRWVKVTEARNERGHLATLLLQCYIESRCEGPDGYGFRGLKEGAEGGVSEDIWRQSKKGCERGLRGSDRGPEK